jgi:outer membrane protein OmpA-like peptidoglycan-associated protein
MKTIAIKYSLIALFLFIFVGKNSSQAPPKSKDQGKIAEYYYAKKEYRNAVPLYLAKQQEDPNNFTVKYKIGVCYFEIDSMDRSSAYFKYALKDPKIPNDTYLYLGKINAILNKFETAAQYYKLYLATLDANSPLRAKIKASILHCVHAQKNYYKLGNLSVENLGQEINSTEDESLPIKDNIAGNRIYFSKAVKNFLGDIYSTAFDRGKWLDMRGIEPYLGEKKEENLVGISSKLNRLYIFSGAEKNWGTVYLDSMRTEDTLQGMGNKLPFSPAWGSSFYIFNDSLVIFSSNNEDSYGGEDLFYTRLLPWGVWSEPKNMGTTINSAFDEKHPFLAKDGRTLYFSSDNPTGNGGFDFFKTIYIDSSKQWSPLELMPMPLNSTGDDIGFGLSDEGLYGYFSSNRAGGFGGQDMYKVTFKRYLPEQQTTKIPVDFSIIAENINLSFIPEKKVDELLIAPAPLKIVDTKTVKTQKETILIPSIYYNQAGGIDSRSYSTINQLSKLLSENPTLRVNLVAHTDSAQITRTAALGLTIKRIKNLAEALIEQGVKKEQLTLRATGFLYPLAIRVDQLGNANPNSALDNNRIEIKLSNKESHEFIVQPIETPVMPHLKDKRGILFNEITNGYYFAVQLTTIKGEMNSPYLDNHTKTFAEILPDLVSTRFCLGPFPSISSAQLNLEMAKSNGFKDAKIHAFHYQDRLDSESAKQHLSSCPDLVILFPK